MESFYFIGVDVSKKKLDFCVISRGKVMREEGVNNHPGAISGLIQVLKQDLDISNDDFLICAEHTGQCTYPLPCACKALECSL